MNDDTPSKPPEPDLPKYLLEPLESQSPERLEVVASYAEQLAEWKREERRTELERRRESEELDSEELEDLEERGVPTNPEDYDEVPNSGAYITVKTTKQTGQRSYRYYYWQWREGDSWENEYIAPVNPRE